MSSTIYKKHAPPYVKCAIQADVGTLREDLASFVRKRIDELGSPSLRDLAKRSRGMISHSTIGDIKNGRYGDVRTGALKGLAAALDVSYEEIQAQLGPTKPKEDPKECRLLMYFRRLPAVDRDTLIEWASMLDRRHRPKVSDDKSGQSKKGRAA